MDLSKVLSITGKSGLFTLVSKGNNNFIVESLTDGKRFPAFSHDGVANLENISIFTNGEDVSLESVFVAMFKKENGAKVSINLNDGNALKAYFAEVLPDYDRERVYVSNIKKVVAWYNQLIDHNLIDLEEKKEETSAEEGEPKAE
ncbi:MAG: DUF5606 domain-containing protein [Bacteroidales bacterium]|jgi:hypothetical protein|nr:DUF5606 domain-containing protein [Bacteroidales bacterium]MCR5115601.1 DUF5606 domain-containing protein [Bacteroidales bacterium]